MFFPDVCAKKNYKEHHLHLHENVILLATRTSVNLYFRKQTSKLKPRKMSTDDRFLTGFQRIANQNFALEMHAQNSNSQAMTIVLPACRASLELRAKRVFRSLS